MPYYANQLLRNVPSVYLIVTTAFLLSANKVHERYSLMHQAKPSGSTSYRSIPLNEVNVRPEAISQDEEVDASKLRIALNRILSEAPRGFKELRAGSGTAIDKSTFYPSSIAIPGTTETLIWIPQDGERRPYVKAEIYTGENKIEAVSRYGMYATRLKTTLPDWKGNEIKSNDQGSERRTVTLQRNVTDATISISYYSNVKSGHCRVSLSFEAPESVQPEQPSPQVTIEPKTKGKDLSAESKQVVRNLIAGNYRDITAEFNDTLLSTVSAELIEEGWITLTKPLGRIKSQDEPELRQNQGWDVVIIRCEMERGSIEVEVAYDIQGKIGGFWIRPR